MASYNAALNSVYNYYLTTYAPKGTSRYDTHKKSELRSIYNSIVKLNKESPLYLHDNSKESQRFAIGLKENARQLRNTIASLGGLQEHELLNKKAVYSTNPDLVSADYIGNVSEKGEVAPLNIEVTRLASGQVNMGTFLPADSAANLPEGAYSFDVTINDLSYEFQYNIRENETNKEIQARLARLISSADIGINADVIEDERGNSSLRLSSTSSGLKNGQDLIFRVSDDNTSKQKGSVSYLGINDIVTQPSNAEFFVNGVASSYSSNHFIIDRKFEVTLNRASSYEGESAEIGLKADIDSLTENVEDLITGYNTFIGETSDYQESYPKSARLVREMNRISRLYQEEFNKIGVSLGDNGSLSLDSDALKQATISDGGTKSLSTIREFANSILSKTGQVTLNPMQYVEKTIVAYKKPGGNNFASPYVTSAYSGMMFNSYC